MSRDSWGTPAYLFRWIQQMYNVDVDICASDNNHLLPVFFTEQDSCLGKNWSEYTKSGYVYCNPPYSDPFPYVEAAVQNVAVGVTTVMLLNLDPSTKWFQLALTKASDVFILTGGRVQFVPPDGIQASTNPKPQCVLVIGDDCGFTDTGYVPLKQIKELFNETPR